MAPSQRIYPAVRSVVSFAVRCFYRIERAGPPLPEGPLLLVGNHPNALVDPGLMIAVSSRRLTFLAKEPIFRMPVLGSLVRALGALPVVRVQDDPSRMRENLEALGVAARGLAEGRAIALFPEGRSHSEPSLGALKTGAARLALQAGVPVRIVPVGLTYAEKGRFRSPVRVEFGPALEVAPAPAEPERVRALTERIAAALRLLTLDLAGWEDLPLIAAADALYVLATAAPARDAERQRLFARGLALLRAEQPERAAELARQVLALQRRLALTRADATDLGIRYRPWTVLRFVMRNLLALVLGLPLAVLGVLVFGLPVLGTRFALRLAGTEPDMVATVKLLTALMLGPLYVAALAVGVGFWFGPWWAVALAAGALPLALFTRRFLARRAEAIRDARLFLVLGNRSARKQQLLAEAQALAARVTAVADEVLPRLTGAEGGPATAR
ncbi:MAG TPA: 1-acyl-sn-glycerol-3-phosphate acyltransferase [Myxococcaceae bacterium]|nr:1-acyl-sn-glycerol-3-phosphate acyltransferase [Myxococcaceae bacterium]